MYLAFYFPKIEKVSAYFQLYFKYGTIYRPYLVKFDVDVCELSRKDSDVAKNKVISLFLKLVEKDFPMFFKGCPYEVIDVILCLINFLLNKSFIRIF